MALGVWRMLPVLQRLGDAYGFWFFQILQAEINRTRLFM